jgi:hypothetical protein
MDFYDFTKGYSNAPLVFCGEKMFEDDGYNDAHRTQLELAKKTVVVSWIETPESLTYDNRLRRAHF